MKSLYMVVERFRNGNAAAVYARFRERGRMAPEGLVYVNSWVDVERGVCYQVMETHNRSLLDQWMANWIDLVDFEVHSVVASAEAAKGFAPGHHSSPA
jgi:hypothetical protein